MERVIMLSSAMVFGVGMLLIFRRWQIWRASHVANHDPLLAGRDPAIPAIVYFTSPMCAPCEFQQKPALMALRDDLGGAVQVIEVNALSEPDAADRWGVMTVPTTFVLDRQGNPREVNAGVASADKLKRQLHRVA